MKAGSVVFAGWSSMEGEGKNKGRSTAMERIEMPLTPSLNFKINETLSSHFNSGISSPNILTPGEGIVYGWCPLSFLPPIGPQVLL